MEKKGTPKLNERELKIFSIFSISMLFVLAFLMGNPREIWEGLKEIVESRDALITDYFELAGYGAAWFNAGLVSVIAMILLLSLKSHFTGITMAALFINLGYALWGKNPVNILPLLLGTFLYAKMHRVSMGRYIYTGLYGTCMAPLVTEMVYILPFSQTINFIIAIATGVFVGFILPPLSMHTVSMHMGYNLFNVGFSAGIIAFVMVCVLKSVGIESKSVLLWKEGRDLRILIFLYAYFIATILYGLFINKGDIKGLKKIFSHPGRSVADFVQMEGAGTTLINMGLVGIVCVSYICIIDGDLSGPVVGAIFTAFGFAAFGVHIKNYLPVLAGVYLSSFITQFETTTPGIQLAAIFAVGVAPIAGQFGVIPGMVAGMLHCIIAMSTTQLYGGLNLYNSGFSGGWVAIVMIPVIESFMTRYRDKKRRTKNET